MNFWSTLGGMILLLLFILGMFYWCRFLFKKIFPNFKNVLKYKVFKFKKDQDIIDIMQELKNNKNEGDKAYKILLLNHIRPKKAKEMVYIQTLLKGGEE